MKNTFRIGLWGLSAAVVALVSGCASEKIVVDYVMPAKAVADVSKVNIAAIRVKANVKGSLAGDNKRNAGLVKQMLASRLYSNGFYQVADDIWADPKTAGELEKMIQGKDSGHGYASLGAMGQGSEKVVLDVVLDLVLHAKPVKKTVPFDLKTIPYKVTQGKTDKKGNPLPPSSEADWNRVVVTQEKKEVTVYEVVAKGTLSASFSAPEGKVCPCAYENKFPISVFKFESLAQPSQLKTLANVVTPAVECVVDDISPWRKPGKLEVVNGGDERVVYLLNAKAFPEVVMVVEGLDAVGKATPADLENLGIAFEAMGEFFNARDAFAKAAKLDPESLSAKEGAKRVKAALAGKKAVKESGAKVNKDTKFSK